MNRRKFLNLTTAAILTTPALLRQASAQEGPFRVKYFPVAPGSGSRDTASAPDGTIWYCGQRNGTLGRLDPRDGSFKQIDLGKGAAPHGVIIGPDGAPWITEGGQNAIARVDPSDHKVQLFRLPESRAYANLNTGVFDKNGIYWFTGQSGIYGRLDPKSGDMTVFKSPRGRGTYGITVTPEATSGTPRSPAITSPGSTPGPATPRWSSRRRRPGRAAGVVRFQGRIWVSEWNSGNVSVHDPADGSWKAWKLPGAGPRCYAVYVDEKDKVWCTDFGANASCASIPQPKSSMPSRATCRAPMCGNSRASPARPGAVSPGPTVSCGSRLSRESTDLHSMAFAPRLRVSGRRGKTLHTLPRLPQPRSGRPGTARPQPRWPDRTQGRRRRGL
jgi:virginiamycin B lyase